MNPRYLYPQDYMADPAANVFNGRLYIYPSHDYDSGEAFDDDGGHFQMRDYHVLSMDDVMHGEVTDHGVILSVDDVPWAEKQMWDNDVVEKNGKYYLFFSAKDYNGVFHLGVAISDRPEGPFKSEAAPIIGSYSIDPCVFKDDDGEVYCYFGGLWGGQLQWYRNNKLKPAASVGEKNFNPTLLPTGKDEALPSRVARMTKDMLQFSEEPKPVVILDEKAVPLPADDPHRFFEASWTFKRNDTYYFTYSTGDSHYLCYATASNPYGPFVYQGVILEPVCGWTTHHSITQYKGQWYMFHHDCKPSEGKDWLRSLKVLPFDFEADGK